MLFTWQFVFLLFVAWVVLVWLACALHIKFIKLFLKATAKSRQQQLRCCGGNSGSKCILRVVCGCAFAMRAQLLVACAYICLRVCLYVCAACDFCVKKFITTILSYCMFYLFCSFFIYWYALHTSTFKHAHYCCGLCGIVAYWYFHATYTT